jgi:putative glutathione S-transferase
MAEVNTSCNIFDHKKKNNESNGYTDELAEKFASEAGIEARPKETVKEIDERGAFIRQPNAFITKFGDKEGELKAYGDKRYKIYWARLCHWSNRPVIARDILGLHDVIKDEVVSGTGESNIYGWGFPTYKDYKDPDTGAHFLSELYKNGNKDFQGRATTPAFVDLKDKKTVNNDYHRLTNYLEVQFRALQPKDAPDLYPKKYRKEIDEFNDWLFPHINNSHYRMSFCTSIEAYEEAYNDFFESLDKLEKRLSENRFIFGDYITDADIRLYPTLERWETYYYHNVGPMKKRLSEYKNIWGYVKELYNIPEFKRYTYFGEDYGRRDKRSFIYRLSVQYDYDKLWATDGERKKLSQDPDHIYLRHPKGESVEDYQSEISDSIWNSKSWEDRNPKNGVISVDASINPLKGLLKNE